MATTGLVQDARFQRHDTGAAHPERPERLARIEAVLAQRGLSQVCTQIAVHTIDLATASRVHDSAYLKRLERACSDGLPYVDVLDCAIGPESFEIARLASGAVINTVDYVMAGRIDNAFCAVRPPGHHAERNLSMGFCLLNNVAIAAQRLLDKHRIDRVLILDFDVHHGNGTQHIFEYDPRVLFVSLHGHPGIVYPGTGFTSERGLGDGQGFTINVPILPPGRDEVYRRAFDEIVLPAAESFAPQFVLLSAGFDAHRLDPLAPMELETESFGWITEEMLGVAKAHANGKLISILEGGYHLDALADSTALHLSRLLQA